MHNLIYLFSFFTFYILCNANKQSYYLHTLLKSKSFFSSPSSSLLHPLSTDQSPVFVGPQHELMQANKISHLPGQPDDVDFDQYAGYVTVDPKAGRALFYYFVESPTNSSTNPLVLWLNGGPGCSSLGYGAMEELGPFRVNSDGKTLFRNNYAWNNVANVIFLESPAGVGFSYSNTSAYYNNTSDATTANDAYTFLINWLERFPQYKARDFYITGESYAGHYVPQLAHTILLNNNNTKHTFINLKGIAIGNAWLDDKSKGMGYYDYLLTHAMISDQTHGDIFQYCDFDTSYESDQCSGSIQKSEYELGNIDILNIYAPICLNPVLKTSTTTASVDMYDPCSDMYVKHYLNTADVQRALHAKPTTWDFCRDYEYWTDWQVTVLPTIESLMASGIKIWLYSGDMDADISIISTRYAIRSLKLGVETAWRPWYFEKEVGGYVIGYKGLTFVTVRGAGHLVPTNQPQRALAMISSFLHGNQLPSSSSS